MITNYQHYGSKSKIFYRNMYSLALLNKWIYFLSRLFLPISVKSIIGNISIRDQTTKSHYPAIYKNWTNERTEPNQTERSNLSTRSYRLNRNKYKRTMKYPQLVSTRAVSAISDWLVTQLEQLGVDASSVYSRLLLSLLHTPLQINALDLAEISDNKVHIPTYFYMFFICINCFIFATISFVFMFDFKCAHFIFVCYWNV